MSGSRSSAPSRGLTVRATCWIRACVPPSVSSVSRRLSPMPILLPLSTRSTRIMALQWPDRRRIEIGENALRLSVLLGADGLAEVANEPVCRQPSNLLQSSGFLKQMARSRDDHELLLRGAKLHQSFLIQCNHGLVASPDNQQRWRFDPTESGSGQIWAAAPGDNGPDDLGTCCRGHEGSSGSCTCAEVANRPTRSCRVPTDPVRGAGKTSGQEGN